MTEKSNENIRDSLELVALQDAEIKSMIHPVRGLQVMLDSDVARLYGYETKYINRTMKRNIGKFPEYTTGRKFEIFALRLH
jgi:hypothetical protein